MAVKTVSDNTGQLRFMVAWRFPGEKTRTAAYYSPSLKSLARMLYHAEQITQESVESLYIHQIVPKGTLEIVAIDKTNSPNVNAHVIHSEVGADYAGDDGVPGDDDEYITDGEDVNVIEGVRKAIGFVFGNPTTDKEEEGPKEFEADTSTKPSIKLLTAPGLVTAGLFYNAYPAPDKGVEDR